MALGYVQQRLFYPDGRAKPEGVALKRDYEAGVPMEELFIRYRIEAKLTLVTVLNKLGAKRRSTGGQDGGISTFKLMRLYAEHGSCAAVAKALGIGAYRVYQRLHQAGWTELRDQRG